MFLFFFQFLRVGIVHYQRSNIVPLETDASRHEHKLFLKLVQAPEELYTSWCSYLKRIE